MTNRTVAAIAAAATMTMLSVPATAQTRYYARERIVGMPLPDAVVYVPTYSTAYSACVGGSQSAPIESCATSQGVPARLSDCSSKPQTISRTCTAPTVI